MIFLRFKKKDSAFDLMHVCVCVYIFIFLTTPIVTYILQFIYAKVGLLYHVQFFLQGHTKEKNP